MNTPAKIVVQTSTYVKQRTNNFPAYDNDWYDQDLRPENATGYAHTWGLTDYPTMKLLWDFDQNFTSKECYELPMFAYRAPQNYSKLNSWMLENNMTLPTAQLYDDGMVTDARLPYGELVAYDRAPNRTHPYADPALPGGWNKTLEFGYFDNIWCHSGNQNCSAKGRRSGGDRRVVLPLPGGISHRFLCEGRRERFFGALQKPRMKFPL